MTDREKDTFRDDLTKDYAPAFVFEDPDTVLVGTVRDITTGYDPEWQEGEYPIIVLENEETGEDVSVHCFHRTMISQLAKENPNIGDRLGIVFKGERKGAKRTYKDFRVKVERPEGSRSFSDVAGAIRQEASDATPEPEGEDDLPF